MTYIRNFRSLKDFRADFRYFRSLKTQKTLEPILGIFLCIKTTKTLEPVLTENTLNLTLKPLKSYTL
jgi:hypothetical protein